MLNMPGYPSRFSLRPPVAGGSRGLIAQIRRKPPLDFCDAHPLPTGAVLDLVLREPVDREITCLRVGEIETADARRRVHRVVLGELDASRRRRVEQVEQRPLFGMI